MSKFTKAPWVVSGTYIKCEKGHIAQSKAIFLKGDELVANAHLIAAAPNGFELGELVIKMCDHHEGLSPDEVDTLYQAATAFIKKCHGE